MGQKIMKPLKPYGVEIYQPPQFPTPVIGKGSAHFKKLPRVRMVIDGKIRWVCLTSFFWDGVDYSVTADKP